MWIFYPSFSTYIYSPKCQNNKSNNPTIGFINFFGTIVWGERGVIREFANDKLTLSSPFVIGKLQLMIQKKYTVCIHETCKDREINQLKNTLENFISNYNFPFYIIITTSAITNLKELMKQHLGVSRLGNKSFYCGDEISPYDEYPWFRFSEQDTQLAQINKLIFHNPHSMFGAYDGLTHINDLPALLITTGQMFSGYDLLFERFPETKMRYGVKFHYYLTQYQKHIYLIESEDLPNLIEVLPNETFIVIGMNMKYQDRLNISKKFKSDFGIILPVIGWFMRAPYKRGPSYRKFIKEFESPIICGEKWIRMN